MLEALQWGHPHSNVDGDALHGEDVVEDPAVNTLPHAEFPDQQGLQMGHGFNPAMRFKPGNSRLALAKLEQPIAPKLEAEKPDAEPAESYEEASYQALLRKKAKAAKAAKDKNVAKKPSANVKEEAVKSEASTDGDEEFSADESSGEAPTLKRPAASSHGTAPAMKMRRPAAAFEFDYKVSCTKADKKQYSQTVFTSKHYHAAQKAAIAHGADIDEAKEVGRNAYKEAKKHYLKVS